MLTRGRRSPPVYIAFNASHLPMYAHLPDPGYGNCWTVRPRIPPPRMPPSAGATGSGRWGRAHGCRGVALLAWTLTPFPLRLWGVRGRPQLAMDTALPAPFDFPGEDLPEAVLEARDRPVTADSRGQSVFEPVRGRTGLLSAPVPVRRMLPTAPVLLRSAARLTRLSRFPLSARSVLIRRRWRSRRRSS